MDFGHIAKIHWQDHALTGVSSLTGLGPVLDPIVRRRSSLFGHGQTSRGDAAHQALQCHIVLSLVDFQTRVGGDVHCGLINQHEQYTVHQLSCAGRPETSRHT